MDRTAQVRPSPYRLDLCPSEERVYSWHDDELAVAPGYVLGSEGESVGEDGVTRQRCGGGHRVIKKKIGGF